MEGEYYAPLAITFLIVCMVFCAFVLYLLLDGKHRRILQYQLAANITFSQALLILFVLTADIVMSVFHKALPLGYCVFYENIECICQLALPWLLFMFSIERLIYIRDPTGHAQKITRAGAITLLVFPWALNVTFCLVTTYPFVVQIENHFHNPHTNVTEYFCLVEVEHYFHTLFDVRMYLGTTVPFFGCFIIMVTVLVMWCCFKHKRSVGQDYSLMGGEVVANVRNSVIAVAVLNIVLCMVYLVEAAMNDFMTKYFLFYIVTRTILLLGVEGIIWITTLGEVRAKFVSMFSRCCKQDAPATPSVSYHKGDENTEI